MIHAQQRALQRYNTEMDMNDIINIAKQIASGNHILIGPAVKGEGRLLSYTHYNNIPYKVLYEPQKDWVRIVTIYPFDVDEYNKLMQAASKEPD